MGTFTEPVAYNRLAFGIIRFEQTNLVSAKSVSGSPLSSGQASPETAGGNLQWQTIHDLSCSTQDHIIRSMVLVHVT